MAEARLHFQSELRALERQTLDGLSLVNDALAQTLVALREHDLELAELVIADDDRIDGRYLEVHQGILTLIARQAPVATDLRLASALLDVIRHVERMGDQCVNIAKLIPLADTPDRDSELLVCILEMGQRAQQLVADAGRSFAARDVKRAEALVMQDDDIDRLNHRSFSLALEIAHDERCLEWAMRMVQASRAIERIADLAVDIGEQTAFVVTGLFREFTDASHPELRAVPAPDDAAQA
jgi:phosphate transport system protein